MKTRGSHLSIRAFWLSLAAAMTAGIFCGCGDLKPSNVPAFSEETEKRAVGVCPPFPLRDEAGNVIDPVKGVNDSAPYSPRQTCGAKECHDYDKITEGFHFTQGKGEDVPQKMAERYSWVTSPGNYGGNWCSPSPLYRQLAPKQNSVARSIDMTSFDFITATCGNCHPGGGPLEFDRDGRRYDTWMNDPASGLASGGDNNLDGDYYKARWSETGVIEADCLLCHQPEYNLNLRNAELANLNFRWAATVGAGFGQVQGRVQANELPKVVYDKTKFDPDGNVVVHMVSEPRNETCLNCHAKPDWKKRGAGYMARTDVHMVAGLSCVDCHAAGSNAVDPRIRGKEVHQFGKGDDPSGWVRNDLDNTVRTCENCHLEGWRNAPRATHAWLPPLHMDTIACQTCHIPARAVKSALVQASDVYNPAPRISPPPKHIWTFYDQQMNFWNHYGELELFTSKDQPTDVTRPTLMRYKGKIYPGNLVHSAWVGFEEEGKPGLNQLFMKDFYQMWMQHRDDPRNKYPELAAITDDNNDGVIEVNRAEEIDALVSASKAYLDATGFPMNNRRLVWVSDNRAYYSSMEYRTLAHEAYEATAYASAYKFSHDIAPARAALGAGGCTDCHRSGAPFFQGAILKTTFSGDDARPVWGSNCEILGLSAFGIRMGSFREDLLKPLTYWLGAIVLLLLAALGLDLLLVERYSVLPPTAAWISGSAAALCILALAWLARLPGCLEYITMRRFTLDANHLWASLVGFGLAVAAALLPLKGYAGHRNLFRLFSIAILVCLAVTAFFGAIMIVKSGLWPELTRFAYTGFEIGLALALAAACCLLVIRFLIMGAGGERLQDTFMKTSKGGTHSSDSLNLRRYLP